MAVTVMAFGAISGRCEQFPAHFFPGLGPDWLNHGSAGIAATVKAIAQICP